MGDDDDLEEREAEEVAFANEKEINEEGLGEGMEGGGHG